uniref:B-cell linker protein isoform X2 n=1 Tax=Scatophagus argus TaxID=75038 RepID=UPI001ED814E4|nr:B-cell linker protein isoform X2 [Scatophagus argus]
MNLPSREECEGWDQTQVAFFLCKNKMQECAATVTRLRIDGQRLLNLSDSDMSKFSLIHQPQLQKIVQDIRKNDSGLLNKLRRLKSKPLPKLPARDYRDDDQQSEPDYDNEMYEDPREDQDDSYEPPPSHRVFTTTPSASFQKGEYLDNCRTQPNQPSRKPLRPDKASKKLPPEPTHMGSDEEDYINPDGSNDDDNYVEPAENPPSNPMMHCGSRAGRDLPMLPTPSPECEPSPDFYEVPDKENNSLSLPTSRASRLSPIPTTHSHSLPPKPSPRVNVRRSPTPVQEPTDNDEYEVCDPEDSTSDKPAEGPPPLRPKPLPRERSPKPPLKPRPDLKPREFESRTLPVMQTEQKPPPKAFTLDMKRPKIPPPQFTSAPANRGSFCAENGSVDQDKDADICNKSWYAACDRKTADDALFRSNKDGAFMVRKSSGQDAQQPYTLVVFYNSRVYNIPVRFIPTTQQYALGREKRGEEYFRSVSHIIENHKRIPLVLIDSQSNTKDATKLCYPVKP